MPAPRFNDGNARILDHRADKPLSAARNKNVDKPAHAHKLGRSPTRGVVYQADGIRVDSEPVERVAHDTDEDTICADSFLSAAEHDRLPHFQQSAAASTVTFGRDS